MYISLPQKRNGMYLFSHKDFDSAAEQLLQEHAPYMFEKQLNDHGSLPLRKREYPRYDQFQ